MIIQKSQNEDCWTLSPNPPTNTHSVKHEIWSESVSDIGDSPVLVVNSWFFFEKKKPPARWANRKRQGRRWRTPRNRHPCYLCQEICKSIWRHFHAQFSRPHQGTGVTDLWGGKVSYIWWYPHHGQYVYVIHTSYHGHFLVQTTIAKSEYLVFATRKMGIRRGWRRGVVSLESRRPGVKCRCRWRQIHPQDE